MNWLAKLEISAETARAERMFDSYAWHRRIWECFPGMPDDERNFLTRIDPLEGAFRAWALAAVKPVCPTWCPPENFALKEISPTFLSHRHYAFDLRANPTKTLVRRDEQGQPLMTAAGKRKQGKRVPLVKQEELRAWLIKKGIVRALLSRKGERPSELPGGFRLVESEEHPLEISPMVESHFRQKGHSAYHGGVQFRGVLEVTDREHFIQTYQAGIGGAKGFGFGLLLLSPVNL